MATLKNTAKQSFTGQIKEAGLNLLDRVNSAGRYLKHSSSLGITTVSLAMLPVLTTLSSTSAKAAEKIQNENKKEVFVNDNDHVTADLTTIIAKAADQIEKDYPRIDNFKLKDLLSDEEYKLAVDHFDVFVQGLDEALEGLGVEGLIQNIQTELYAVKNILKLQDPNAFLKDFRNDQLKGNTTYWAMIALAKQNPEKYNEGFKKFVKQYGLDADTDLSNIDRKIAEARAKLHISDKCTEVDYALALIAYGHELADIANGVKGNLSKNEQIKLRVASLEALYAGHFSHYSSRDLSALKTSFSSGGVYYNALNLTGEAELTTKALAQLLASIAIDSPTLAKMVLKHAGDAQKVILPISSLRLWDDCINVAKDADKLAKTPNASLADYLKNKFTTPAKVLVDGKEYLLQISEAVQMTRDLMVIVVEKNNNVTTDREKSGLDANISFKAETGQSTEYELYAGNWQNLHIQDRVPFKTAVWDLFRATGTLSLGKDFDQNKVGGKSESDARGVVRGGAGIKSISTQISTGSELATDAGSNEGEGNDEGAHDLGDMFGGGFGQDTTSAQTGSPSDFRRFGLENLKNENVAFITLGAGGTYKWFTAMADADLLIKSGKQKNNVTLTNMVEPSYVRLSGKLDLLKVPFLLKGEEAYFNLGSEYIFNFNGIHSIGTDTDFEKNSVLFQEHLTYPQWTKEQSREIASMMELGKFPFKPQNTHAGKVIVGFNWKQIGFEGYVRADRRSGVNTKLDFSGGGAIIIRLNSSRTYVSKKSHYNETVNLNGTRLHSYEDKTSTLSSFKEYDSPPAKHFLINGVFNILGNKTPDKGNEIGKIREESIEISSRTQEEEVEKVKKVYKDETGQELELYIPVESDSVDAKGTSHYYKSIGTEEIEDAVIVEDETPVVKSKTSIQQTDEEKPETQLTEQQRRILQNVQKSEPDKDKKTAPSEEENTEKSKLNKTFKGAQEISDKPKKEEEKKETIDAKKLLRQLENN